MSDNEYNVGTPAPPEHGPPGPAGPAPIPTKPSKTNTGYVRGGTKDGKLRNSGCAGAHRIGKR